MDAKKRTDVSIGMTRKLLMDALDHPEAIMTMIANDLTPEVIQDCLYSILMYLEKTAPEQAEEPE